MPTPQAIKIQQTSIPNFINNNFREKSVCAIPSIRKPRFGSPKRRKIESEIIKKLAENKPKNKKISTYSEPKN